MQSLMMSPGKGLWEMKPTTEWQMFGVECPLVAITGTPTGDRDNIIFFLFFSFLLYFGQINVPLVSMRYFF